MWKIGDHAVVLGSGMAGLLAARVLSDGYGGVTVLERDPLPENAGERRDAFPARLLLLVVGDAVCGTNPAYALGMSVAAVQAAALRDALAGGDRDLARRFRRAAARPAGVAWQLAVGGDPALPLVPGPRPLPVRVLNAYVARVQAAAEHDPVIARRLLRVVSLQDRPTRLFRPATVVRALLRSLRRRPASPVGAVDTAVTGP